VAGGFWIWGIRDYQAILLHRLQLGLVAGVRWADRVGKGIRTAPRDALVADSVTPQTRGIAFGFHRAMDTAGAMLGILIAALVVWLTQKNELLLSRSTFQTIVLISLIPAFLAVLTLAFGAKDVTTKGKSEAPRISLKSMGRSIFYFSCHYRIARCFDIH